MGKAGFVIGTTITILSIIGIAWVLLCLWNALIVHGVLGITIFLIFIIVAFPLIIACFILALLPMIMGANE